MFLVRSELIFCTFIYCQSKHIFFVMLCSECDRPARKGKYCTLHFPKKCRCGNVSANECASCTKSGNRCKKYEMHMRQELCKNGVDDFIHNKKLIGTNISPDFLWERENSFVVLEVDENAHQGYSKEAEKQRMRKISVVLKKKVIFIRLVMPCSDETVNQCVQLIEEALQNGSVEVQCSFISILQYFGGECI